MKPLYLYRIDVVRLPEQHWDDPRGREYWVKLWQITVYKQGDSDYTVQFWEEFKAGGLIGIEDRIRKELEDPRIENLKEGDYDLVRFV